MKPLTPQLVMLAGMSDDEVAAFCQHNGLVSVRDNAKNLIAYPASMDITLQEWLRSEVVISQIHPRRPLRNEVHAHISDGHRVIIAPSPKDMRHFFWPSGFIQAMTKLSDEMSKAEVIIPVAFLSY